MVGIEVTKYQGILGSRGHGEEAAVHRKRDFRIRMTLKIKNQDGSIEGTVQIHAHNFKRRVEQARTVYG